VFGFRRHEKRRGVHPHEGQGVAQDEFNDDAGRINDDDRGDHNNSRKDATDPRLMVAD
jgi:hypothetical protein